ncbi:Unknown protein [Striga hermonthica]|uniref:Uncharacterized protein n=1 Tax=Striga hermonthica TaxID=68872 RepID=A0A9N7NFC8_STRHE|nr:Unknown protein [Striga hermonthica]
MRIRRHAKISPAPPLHPYACQLNQSPWDAMEFAPPSAPPQPPPPPPPPPPQAGAGAFAAGNGRSNERFSAGKSLPENDATTLKVEQQIFPAAEQVDPSKITSCSKTDGESYAYGPPASKPMAHRPARPKKSSSFSTNPYEFYYYSGFGPRWAKKRGTSCDADDDNGGTTNKRHEIERQKDYSDYDEPNYDKLEEEEEEKKERKRARKPIKARSLKSLM